MLMGENICLHLHPPKYFASVGDTVLVAIPIASLVVLPSASTLTPDSLGVTDTTHVFQFFYPFTSINGCVVTCRTVHLPERLDGLYMASYDFVIPSLEDVFYVGWSYAFPFGGDRVV